MLKLEKRKSTKTYKDKEGNEKHNYNFYIVNEDGRSVQIKPSFTEDWKILNFLAQYVENKYKD